MIPTVATSIRPTAIPHRTMSPPTRRLASLLLLLAAAFVAAPAAAAGPEEWAVSGGWFDIGKPGGSVEAGAELRFSRFDLPLFSHDFAIQPGLGATVNGDDSYYGYFTLRYDLPREWLGEAWRATIFSGGGIYSAGDGKNLGGPWEFRSGLEIDRAVSPRSRLGLTYYHLSNAGIYDVNPGSESLHLVLSVGL